MAIFPQLCRRFMVAMYHLFFPPSRAAGDVDIIHLTTPPPPPGGVGKIKKKLLFYYDIVCGVCQYRRGIYPHIKSNNVTSHHMSRIKTTHYIYIPGTNCCDLLLGCTLHGRVVSGLTILHDMSKISVVLPLYGPRRHSMMRFVNVKQCQRFFRRWRTGHVRKQVAGEVSHMS